MMLYLPIAEMSVNVFVIIGLGAGIGVLSGLFGVGGGFLLTPLLFMIGIPPSVAVATSANQIIASSVSGVFAHWRQRNVDIRMGILLTLGGFLGSTLGVLIFSLLKEMGQIDVFVKLCYVVFLGSVGALMTWESMLAVLRARGFIKKVKPKHKKHSWVHGLPLRIKFRTSGLYLSALLPIGLGFGIGMLTALMGVGGGFIMVPAMIYLLGMPTLVVIGTSLLQIIFVTVNVTFLQAVATQSVDIVLAALLIIGGVIGAQLGARFAGKIKGEELRLLLALLVLGVALKLLVELVLTPGSIYVLEA